MKPFSFVLGIVVFLGIGPALTAELSVPRVFSDHMVLQRGQKAAVWGKASPGAAVEVEFKHRKVSATADPGGRWKAWIETGAADAQGAKLVITAGKDSITLEDVLVGEVWFASGQSNMAFPVRSCSGAEALIAKADYPAFRLFKAPNVTAEVPQEDIAGKWEVCSPQTIPAWSGVASYFAIQLHRELGVPVGVIQSSWGGKPVEAFTSRDALQSHPASKKLVDALLEAERHYDPESARVAYEKKLEEWKQGATEPAKPGNAERTRAKRPEVPKRPLLTERNPGVLYDAMIHPFVGYTMQGAIWYQGEANARVGAVPYDESLPLLIRDWRARWGSEFSFYFVQLANYRPASTEPGTPDSWALLQDRMRRVLGSTPKTGMAVINDVGEARDIHPKDKQTPGERLARWALAKDYGRSGVWSGPLYASHVIRDQAVVVTFEHVGKGLKVRDQGSLKRFEIAGEDRKWSWADAVVSAKDTVTVRSANVPKPVAVRYAWASNPEGANLVNSENLPASVFRTDDWPDAEPLETPVTARVKQREAIHELAEQIKKLPPKSEEAATQRARLESLMKAFKDSAPPPAPAAK